jgi:hypothetical protein
MCGAIKATLLRSRQSLAMTDDDVLLGAALAIAAQSLTPPRTNARRAFAEGASPAGAAPAICCANR